MHRILDAFSRWFGSSWGVVETFAIVCAVITVEYLAPGLDPHWFWLLVWLTVYSAITQPALAFGNEKASRQLRETLDKLSDLEAQLCALEREHGKILRQLAERSLRTQAPEVQAITAAVATQLAHHHDALIEALRGTRDGS